MVACVCVDNLIDSNLSKMMKMIIMMATIGLRFSFLFSFFLLATVLPSSFCSSLVYFLFCFLDQISEFIFNYGGVVCCRFSFLFFHYLKIKKKLNSITKTISHSRIEFMQINYKYGSMAFSLFYFIVIIIRFKFKMNGIHEIG